MAAEGLASMQINHLQSLVSNSGAPTSATIAAKVSSSGIERCAD